MLDLRSVAFQAGAEHMYFRTSKKYPFELNVEVYLITSPGFLTTENSSLLSIVAPMYFFLQQKQGALRPASTFQVTTAALNDAAAEGLVIRTESSCS